MAKKNQNIEIDIPDVKSIGKAGSNVWQVVVVVLLGCIIYRSGYRMGVDVSNKILRRHDRDVREMGRKADRRERELRRELSPEKEKKWKWWPW